MAIAMRYALRVCHINRLDPGCTHRRKILTGGVTLTVPQYLKRP
jgi:hypothetical protein